MFFSPAVADYLKVILSILSFCHSWFDRQIHTQTDTQTSRQTVIRVIKWNRDRSDRTKVGSE